MGRIHATPCDAVLVTIAVVLGTLPAVAHAEELKAAWELEIKGCTPQALIVAERSPPLFYLAAKAGGLLVLEGGERDHPPREIARVPIDRFGKLDVMHLTQRGTRLFLALGSFFAAGGSQAGLAVVSLQDPRRPQVLGLWTSPTTLKGSAMVVADERFAYLGAMTEGVMIFDISRPEQIKPVTTYQPDPHFPRANPSRIQHPNARGLALNGERLFVADDAGGLRVLDVSHREKPQEIGRYLNAKMKTKQQAYNNIVLVGNFAYVAVDYAGLEILDVTNPRDIKQLGWWNPWKAETLGNLWFNSPGHTNQLAFDPVGRRVYLSAGDSELQVVNVADPRRPQLVSHFGKPKNGRGAWGLTLAGQRVYLLDVQTLVPFRGTWSGLVAIQR